MGCVALLLDGLFMSRSQEITQHESLPENSIAYSEIVKKQLAHSESSSSFMKPRSIPSTFCIIVVTTVVPVRLSVSSGPKAIASTATSAAMLTHLQLPGVWPQFRKLLERRLSTEWLAFID